LRKRSTWHLRSRLNWHRARFPLLRLDQEDAGMFSF
jgi:hypothetical protein